VLCAAASVFSAAVACSFEMIPLQEKQGDISSDIGFD
jgi:hypothetical protein